MKINRFKFDDFVKYFIGSHENSDEVHYLKGSNLVDIFERGRGTDAMGIKTRSEYAKFHLDKMYNEGLLANFLIEFINSTEKKELIVKQFNQCLEKPIEVTSNGLYYFNDHYKHKTDIQVSFEKQEEIILAELDKAKFLIWAAIAWITNKNIIEKLNKKYKEGVSVRIIMNDDQNNDPSLFSIKEIYKYSPTNGFWKNTMHHKFCVIDSKRVLSGSYNWTNKAEFNNENMQVIEDKSVIQYMTEFNEIIKEINL